MSDDWVVGRLLLSHSFVFIRVKRFCRRSVLHNLFAVVVIMKIVNYFLLWLLLYFLSGFVSSMFGFIVLVLWLTLRYFFNYYYPLLSLCLLGLLLRLRLALALVCWLHGISQTGLVQLLYLWTLWTFWTPENVEFLMSFIERFFLRVHEIWFIWFSNKFISCDSFK